MMSGRLVSYTQCSTVAGFIKKFELYRQFNAHYPVSFFPLELSTWKLLWSTDCGHTKSSPVPRQCSPYKESVQHSDPYCRPLADRPAFTSNGIHIFVVSSASIRCEMFDWHLTLPCNGGFTSPRLTMSLSVTLRLLNSSLIYSLPVCLYFGSLCFLPHTAANVVQ